WGSKNATQFSPVYDVVNTGSWVSTLVLDPTRLSNRRFVSR
ncbi:unnamed protein product, partial [Brassica oleracea]